MLKKTDNYIGTSLQDEVDISFAELVRVFGEPHTKSEDGKMDAQWAFETPYGTATIYNYKSGPAYNDGMGSVEEIRDWHIGGEDKTPAAFMVGYIEALAKDKE